MPTIKYTREDIAKLENERDQLKHQDNLLREDITLLKKNQKTRDKLIDNLKEENANLNNELNQYKTAHDKLTAGLKEAVAESIKYKRERNENELKLQNIIKVLKEISKTLEKEADMTLKLDSQLHDMTKQRDSLIKGIENQRELLKDFSKFIDRKVVACPGKKEYMDFRDRLNDLGIGERDYYAKEKL